MSIKPKIKSRPDFFSLDKTHPLAKGLVFAGLGRGRGSLQLRDSSPYGNHGVLTNMEPSTDWVFDPTLGRWALDYDGSNDWVAIPSTPATTQVSVSLWVRPAVGPGEYGYPLLSKSGAGTDRDWALVTGNYIHKIGWLHYNGGWISYETYGAAVFAGQWTHIAISHDGVNLAKLWVNGTSYGWYFKPASGSPIVSTANNIGLGDDPDLPYTFPTNGRLADACIWNRPITESEAAQLADPSNVRLSRLIKDPERRLWSVGYVVPPAGSSRRRRLLCTGAQ